MITTAKIQNFVRQIQQIDIAVANFQTTYNTLPGDTDKTGHVGNNDGIIEDAHFDPVLEPGEATYYSGEELYFWTDLSSNGFDANHQYVSTIATTFNADPNNLNAPTTTFGKNTSILIFSNMTYGSQPSSYLIGDYHLMTAANPSFTPSTAGCNQHYPGSINAIKPYDALAIDQKIDDGFLGYNATSNMYASYLGTDACRGCALNDSLCTVSIKMLSQVGQSN